MHGKQILQTLLTILVVALLIGTVYLSTQINKLNNRVDAVTEAIQEVAEAATVLTQFTTEDSLKNEANAIINTARSHASSLLLKAAKGISTEESYDTAKSRATLEAAAKREKK